MSVFTGADAIALVFVTLAVLWSSGLWVADKVKRWWKSRGKK